MPEAPGTLHNWSTAEPYLATGGVAWLKDGLDKTRVAAINFYDSVYQNAPNTWQILMYETNRRPVYVPSAKILINAINRYIAPNMEVITDPATLAAAPVAEGPDGVVVDPAQPLRDLFYRERFYAKFAAEKKMWRVRGDMVILIQGDELKPEGSRLSISFVDPASYFPIWSEEDPDVRIGCHIVDQWDIDGDAFIFRTTFRKQTPDGVVGGPGIITVEEAIFEVDEWGGPNMEEGTPKEVPKPPTPLDTRITEIPVYHIKANHRNGEDWGTSDLAGLEALFVAVNQNASDEDIALALAGLGVYTSDAGEPVDDETGQPVGWQIGPGRVVEMPVDHNFNRVPGITSVQPYQDHIELLRTVIRESMGISDVAQGRVSVDVAESGIALALEMAPTLSMAEEQELELTSVLINFFFDLRAWLQVYEGISIPDVYRFIPKYGEKIPLNRKQRFDELVQLFTLNVVSAAYFRRQLSMLGYEMPDDATMMEEIIAEKTAMQQIVSDVTGARMDQEIASGNPANQ